jgi:hypothetical protein
MGVLKVLGLAGECSGDRVFEVGHLLAPTVHHI